MGCAERGVEHSPLSRPLKPGFCIPTLLVSLEGKTGISQFDAPGNKAAKTDNGTYSSDYNTDIPIDQKAGHDGNDGNRCTGD